MVRCRAAIGFAVLLFGPAHADPRLGLLEPLPPFAERDRPIDRLSRVYRRAAVTLWRAGNFGTLFRADGSVRFRDHPFPSGELRLDPAHGPSYFGPYDAVGATIDPYPVHDVIVSFRMELDLNDAIMRALHEDPYRIEKQRVLDETLLLRAELAAVQRRELMLAALDRLPSHLTMIWINPGYSAVERREILAALWCDADSTMPGRTDGRTAGQEARSIIEAFLRRELGAPATASAFARSCRVR
jgi:hypothetical protein